MCTLQMKSRWTGEQGFMTSHPASFVDSKLSCLAACCTCLITGLTWPQALVEVEHSLRFVGGSVLPQRQLYCIACRAIGHDGMTLKGRNLKIGYAQKKKE